MSNTEVEENVEEEIIAQEPKMFKVLFFNDDKTTFQFVIEVLQLVFHKTFDDAIAVTQQIHETGQGVAGVYNREIAEEKTDETVRIARMNGFPLNVTYEEL